jgi:hypothetical protein
LKGAGTIEYHIQCSIPREGRVRPQNARRISEAMRFFGLDRLTKLDKKAGLGCYQARTPVLYACYYVPISLNRTLANSGKPPLPFGLEKQDYRVVLAVIVRTRADFGVAAKPLLRRPIVVIAIAATGGLAPESGRDAGLSKTG